MQVIYLVFTTDSHHLKNSRRLIAVTSEFDIAITLIDRDMASRGRELSEQWKEQLKQTSQTQGLENEYEYEIHESLTNHLLNQNLQAQT